MDDIDARTSTPRRPRSSTMPSSSSRPGSPAIRHHQQQQQRRRTPTLTVQTADEEEEEEDGDNVPDMRLNSPATNGPTAHTHRRHGRSVSVSVHLHPHHAHKNARHVHHHHQQQLDKMIRSPMNDYGGSSSDDEGAYGDPGNGGNSTLSLPRRGRHHRQLSARHAPEVGWAPNSPHIHTASALSSDNDGDTEEHDYGAGRPTGGSSPPRPATNATASPPIPTQSALYSPVESISSPHASYITVERQQTDDTANGSTGDLSQLPPASVSVSPTGEAIQAMEEDDDDETPYNSTATLVHSAHADGARRPSTSTTPYHNHLRFGLGAPRGTNTSSILQRRHSAANAGINTATNNPVDDDDDDDDNDDARSVIEETEQDNPYINQALGDGSSGDESRKHRLWQFLSTWFWSLLVHGVLIAMFLVPGVLCDLYSAEKCVLFYTPLMYYSIIVSVGIAGHFMGGFVVAIVLVLIRRTPFLGKHFVYYVHNLNRPLKWAIVAMVVQITWPSVFYDTTFFNQTYGDMVNSFIACATLTCWSFLAKALAMRFIAVRFHRGAYYKRIRAALMSEFVVTTLLTGPKRLKDHEKAIRAIRAEKEAKASLKAGGAYSSSSLSNFAKYHHQRQWETVVNDVLGRGSYSARVAKNGTVSLHTEIFLFDTMPMSEQEMCDRRPFSNHKLAVFVEFIKENEFAYDKGVFRQYLLAYQADGFNFKYGSDGNVLAIETEEASRELAAMSSSQQARILAKILYNQLKGLAGSQSTMHEAEMADHPSSCVYLEDFVRILSPEMAGHGFALFDGNWDGSLSESEFYTTLMAISRERKALRTALNDAESAIAKLDDAIVGVLMIVLMVAYFMIFRVDPNKVLLTVSSFLLATAFAIGSSAKALLESIIFLFVTHPFDIGDRVVLDDVVYTVSRMNLLTTELKRFDNAVLYFSNAYLSTRPLVNLRRSPDQFDIIKTQISFYTPMSSLRLLEQRLAQYIHKHSAHYYRKFEVEYREIEDTNRLSLRIWAQHRSNFQNMRRMRERRGRLVLRLKRICEELGIEYEMPAQRVIHDGIINGNVEDSDEFAEGNGSMFGYDGAEKQTMMAAAGGVIAGNNTSALRQRSTAAQQQKFTGHI